MKKNYLLIFLLFFTINASKCELNDTVKLTKLEVKNDNSNLLQILNTIADYKTNHCDKTSLYFKVHILVTDEKYQDALKGKRVVLISGISKLSENLKYCSGYIEINKNYFFIDNGSGKGVEELGNIFITTDIEKTFKTAKTENDDSIFLDDDSIECLSCQLYYKDSTFFFYEERNGNLSLETPSEYPACYNNDGSLNLFIKK